MSKISKDATKASNNGTIIFIHPDLGIGGAERLVIDAAVGLQSLGHRVVIYTSHCSPSHCFDEARDGTLDVRVRGSRPIPPAVLGRFSILCATLRQLHLVLSIHLSGELASLRPTAFFVDQLSACLPLLRWAEPGVRVLFYVHFPDKLLATRGGKVRELYRCLFDWWEGWSMGYADRLVGNSDFTRGVFRRAFPGLRRKDLGVVYPCVHTEEDGKMVVDRNRRKEQLWKGKKVVLSINRFERKKGIEVAIRAYAGLRTVERAGTRLVVAGGYDPRSQENYRYHNDLLGLAESLDLKCATTRTLITALNVSTEVEVLFLLSVPAALKSMLLSGATLVVYTPANEHFGIVPLEAMFAGAPVLAANSGGPLETVVDGETGWLRDPERVEEWTEIINLAVNRMGDDELKTMAEKGRRRVKDHFSEEIMAKRLDEEIRKMQKEPRQEVSSTGALMVFGGFVVLLAVMMSSVGAMALRRWQAA